MKSLGLGRKVGARSGARGVMVPAAKAAAVAVIVALAGCTIQLDTPRLELTSEPAYSSSYVLLPYQVMGDGSYADARWVLRRFRPDVSEWEISHSWDITVPNGSSGILQLDGLADGKYEISGELLTGRGGLSAAAPSLTVRAEFYVDQQPPTQSIVLNDSQGGGPDPLGAYAAGTPLELYPAYSGVPNPDFESPVALYHAIDSTVPPSQDQDPTGATLPMWAGGAASYSRVLTIIAIDQAGNVGSYRVETYNGS